MVERLVPLLSAAAALGIVIYLAGTAKDRLKFNRGLLWVGIVAPLTVSATREASAISGGGLGAADMARAGIPMVCLVIALTLSRPLRRGIQAPELLLGAFAAWALGSTVWSTEPRATLLKAIVAVVFYLCLVALVRRYATPMAALSGFVSLVHFLLLATVVGVVVAPGLAFDTLTGGIRRLSGAFIPLHPNVVGLLAVVGIMAVLTKVGPAWALRTGPRVALFAVYIVVLVAARARAALIVGAIMLIYSAVRSTARNGFLLFGILASIVIGAGIAISELDRVSGFLARGQSSADVMSLTGRTTLWDRALVLWEQRPFTGWGYYSGHRFMIQFIPGAVEQSNLDSLWIEALVDVGLVGALLLALFVITGSVRALRAARALPIGERAYVHGAMALGLTASFFNPSIQTTGYQAIFWGTLLLAFIPAAPEAEAGMPPSDAQAASPRVQSAPIVPDCRGQLRPGG